MLNGLDLNIHSGELVALLGPSGCGKSTLLRIIAGFEAADQGSVLLDDVDVSGVPTNRRDIGLVFQAYSLFPHLNAVENVMYGLSIRHVAKTEAKSSAVELLASVGLADYADRYPAQLSGGQQQRVALARALATKPRVLLLDEPLSALDAKVRVQLRDEIRALQLETISCHHRLVVRDGETYGYRLADSEIARFAVISICNDPADVSFIYLGEVDEAGHLYGGISEEYESALSRVDEHVGEILDAVERRSSNYPDEDWLVCITTDHGHLDEGGHGGADPVLRRSFFGALRLGARSSDQYSFESMRPEQIAGWMLRHLDTPIR